MLSHSSQTAKITSIGHIWQPEFNWHETAKHLESNNDPFFNDFLILVARNTNSLFDMTSWLGSSNVRDPVILDQLNDILCSRFPHDCDKIQQGISQLKTAPIGVDVDFDIPRNTQYVGELM